MPSDNLVLNAGSGGATMRTLADASSNEWAASVVCYATTVSPGANVLQVVTTAAGLPVAQQGTWTVAATQSGNWTARVVGNAGATLDAAGQNASSPANSLLVAAQFNTTPTTITSGNMSPLQMDSAGNLLVNVKAGGASGGTSSSFAAAFPSTGTAIGVKDSSGVNMVAMNVDASGFLKVNVSAGTVAATQSGTWTVQPGNTPNTTPWLASINAGGNTATVTASNALKVDGSAVTQPVSIASAVTVAQATAASLNATVVGTGTFAVQAAQSGTWNIGTVTTVTTVSAVTAITNALPAGTNLLGQISASNETGTVYNGTTAITPSFASIAASSSGSNTIVSATGGKRIRVLRWSLSSNGTVNAKWQTSTGPTDLTGLRYLVANATAGGAYAPVGLFQTGVGDSLILNLSAAVAVGGELTYILV